MQCISRPRTHTIQWAPRPPTDACSVLGRPCSPFSPPPTPGQPSPVAQQYRALCPAATLCRWNHRACSRWGWVFLWGRLMFLKFVQATSSAAGTCSSSLLYNKPCGNTLPSCLSCGWRALGFRFQRSYPRVLVTQSCPTLCGPYRL